MNKETLFNASNNIDNFTDKLSEIIFEEINSDDTSMCDIGKHIMYVINECESEREFQIANGMLISICGWSFDSLIEKIQEYDEEYEWL